MKESLSATVKLLYCDLKITGSNSGTSLLQCKVKMHTIYLMWSDPSPKPLIGGSFVH